MDFAIISTGGKQYKVTPGQILEVDRLKGANGSIVFDRVLLHAQDGSTHIGAPFVNGVTVTAKVLGEVKGEKISGLRFLAKSRHRRRFGFRASLSRIQVESIGKSDKKDDSAPVKAKTPAQSSKKAKKE